MQQSQIDIQDLSRINLMGLVSRAVHHGAHSVRPGTRGSPDSGTACGIPWTVAADDVAGRCISIDHLRLLRFSEVIAVASSCARFISPSVATPMCTAMDVP